MAELTYHLGDFDGPLDLLLHLIKINEMDILDIPIVEITEQYLAFLHAEEERNLDVAGEFLVMAATLMSIKARYLLPKIEPELTYDEDLAELVYEEDPRDALMQQLLEYQRYQVAADELREREDARQLQFSRAPMAVPDDIDVIPLPYGIALTDLQTAFSQMLVKRNRRQKQVRTMETETWSIKQQMQVVIQQLHAGEQVAFNDLFAEEASNEQLVTTFLAVLELVRHQHLLVDQADSFGPITVSLGKVPYHEEQEETVE